MCLQSLAAKVYRLSSLLRAFGFVAERRLNLARPFKAGIVAVSKHVALATIE
jgi:hypothetical protein